MPTARSVTQSYTIATERRRRVRRHGHQRYGRGSDTVAEDATIGDAVGITAQATDADATTNAITYTLDDDAGGRFAINGSTGLVTVNAALDYETNTSHSVTVRATSADGSSSTQTYTINVTDVNESAPRRSPTTTPRRTASPRTPRSVRRSALPPSRTMRTAAIRSPTRWTTTTADALRSTPAPAS